MSPDNDRGAHDPPAMDAQTSTPSQEYVNELEQSVAALMARHQPDRVVMALVNLHTRYVTTRLLEEMKVQSAMCSYCGALLPVKDQDARDHHNLNCKSSPAVARIHELEVKVARRIPTVVPMTDRIPHVLHALMVARAIDLEMLMEALKTHPLVQSTTVNLSDAPKVDAPWEFTIEALPLETEVSSDGHPLAPPPNGLLACRLYRGAGDTIGEACQHALVAWMENHAARIGDDI